MQDTYLYILTRSIKTIITHIENIYHDRKVLQKNIATHITLQNDE